ncbi:HypA protein [Trichoderma gamsii]|uniref:HypA protein n=1 Tax=Trichoderma gamsii TaxID=398673 RepID=A0A2P4ZQQ4_9HYPO|nr:HypA protein [Trichoderma gamsii]PON26592.1 HypA protein [Trichoderma gamsii]
MATAYKIQIDPNRVGLLGYKHNETAAAKLSELLQKDLDRHHVFFLARGYHNHMAHHLCTLYGAGATPEELQAAFDRDAELQVDQFQLNDGVLEDLRRDWAANAPKYLGDAKYYTDFLRYFQEQVDARGWKNALVEYLFSGKESTHDMYRRSWGSFAHSFIQLMYGIEWDQPAIIAQGLAQSAIHDTYVGDFLNKVDKAAANRPSQRLNTSELYEQVHSDPAFVNSVRNGNPNKILNSVEVLCPDEAVNYLTQVKADPKKLAEGIAENIHAAAYMASACVFHPPDYPRFDFFLIHHLTIGPFLLLIQDVTWIPDSVKLQTLEWKTRFDILHYVVRWAPPLQLGSISSYMPKDSALVKNWEELLPGFINMPDDGHVVKTARALGLAQRLSQEYLDRPWIRIRDDKTWLNTQYLLLDSTWEHPEFPWVRTAGWDEAWKDSGLPETILVEHHRAKALSQVS